jgi:hypothetical protein
MARCVGVSGMVENEDRSILGGRGGTQKERTTTNSTSSSKKDPTSNEELGITEKRVKMTRGIDRGGVVVQWPLRAEQLRRERSAGTEGVVSRCAGHFQYFPYGHLDFEPIT